MLANSIFNKSIKFLVPSIFAIILCLKLTEKPGQWLSNLTMYSGNNLIGRKTFQGEEKVLKSKKELVDELENFERNFFRNRDEPTILSQKCDACRAIAFRLDSEFERAEAEMGIAPNYDFLTGNENFDLEELDSDHVKEILHKVCRRKTFTTAKPIFLNGKWRLAAPGLETAFYYNKLRKRTKEQRSDPIINTPHKSEMESYSLNSYQNAINGDTKHSSLHTDWPQRLKNHCIYITTDRLHEAEAYDLWLRTSAGQLRTFEDFLCFGEHVFGDCVEPLENDIVKNSHVFSSSYKNEGSYSDSKSNFEKNEDKWPAGDQRDENDIEDEESEDEEVVNERKSDFMDLYGINSWNYESIDD